MPVDLRKPLFIIRVGIAIVFLWFGISKIIDPTAWISWLPQWIVQLPISVTTNLIIQGMIETVVGALLLIGLFTRFAAVIAALTMVIVIISVGYSDIAIRDLGILSIAVALALTIKHPLSLDGYLRKKT